jgi:uncharacterized protein Usg
LRRRHSLGHAEVSAALGRRQRAGDAGQNQGRRQHAAFAGIQPDEDRMSLAKQIEGYRLTTAEILYHLPDHPGLLQTYVWQEFDIAPRFPVLQKFLDFWSRQLDGKLHSVRVGSVNLISPGEMRHASQMMFIN